MRKEQIVSMIDRKISKSIIDGQSIRLIQQELQEKIDKFYIAISSLDDRINISKIDSVDIENIQSVRTRYQIIYIKICLKRIEDLNWLVRSKLIFTDKNDYQIFKLLKLKEKLSFENALPF